MPNLSVFQTVLLAAFGALAVSGVLIFALFVSNNSGTTIGPVTIWGTLEESAFRVVLRQTAENDERLSQVAYIQKDEDGYTAELTEALASGTGPDLFLLRQDYAVRDAAKVLAIPYDQLSETQFRNAFIDAAEPYLGEEGVIAIPILADPLVLYWNKDMLAAAGYARPPQYWDQLQGMAQNITKKNDAGQILKSTISFGEYRNVDYAKDILSMLILQAGGLITAKNSAGRLTSALSRTGGGSQATESALRFYTEFADPSKTIYSWSRALPDSRTSFSTGNVALYIGYASERNLITRMNPNLNFAVAPMPQARTSEKVIDVARVYALATARAAKNPQGAVTVSSLLASADVSKALSTVYGIPSARRDVLSASESSESFTTEADLFNKQAIVSRAWSDPDPQRTDEVFRAMIENVTTGTLRLQEAVGRAHQELDHILDI